MGTYTSQSVLDFIEIEQTRSSTNIDDATVLQGRSVRLYQALHYSLETYLFKREHKYISTEHYFYFFVYVVLLEMGHKEVDRSL